MQTPVDPGGRPIERRRFVRLLVGGIAVSTLAMVVTPFVGFLIPPRRTASSVGGSPLLVGATDDTGPGRSTVVALAGMRALTALQSGEIGLDDG
jgi:hypothetical protein